MRMIFSQEVMGLLQVERGSSRPSNARYGRNIRRIRASISSSSMNSLRSACSRLCARPRKIAHPLPAAQCGIFYQLLPINALPRGNGRQPRPLFRCEMDLHARQFRTGIGARQSVK